jgi:adenylosuccinate synthase
VVRLIPSGILPHARCCLMSQGMVVDPGGLAWRDRRAREARPRHRGQRLFISDRAHLILPYHVLIDGLREDAAATSRRSARPRRASAPATRTRRAPRPRAWATCATSIARARRSTPRSLAWAPWSSAISAASLPHRRDPRRPRAAREALLPAGRTTLGKLRRRRGPRGQDTSSSRARRARCSTSTTAPIRSSPPPRRSRAARAPARASARAASTASSASPRRTRRASARAPSPASSRRVGEHLRTQGRRVRLGHRAPAPHRLARSAGAALRRARQRPRRLAITKLDVLTGLETVRVCVAYDTPAGRTEDFPVTELGVSRPVFEDLPGWSEAIEDIRELSQLPSNAARVVRAIEEKTGVGADIVSVGPRRDQTRGRSRSPRSKRWRLRRVDRASAARRPPRRGGARSRRCGSGRASPSLRRTAICSRSRT